MLSHDNKNVNLVEGGLEFYEQNKLVNVKAYIESRSEIVWDIDWKPITYY